MSRLTRTASVATTSIAQPAPVAEMRPLRERDFDVLLIWQVDPEQMLEAGWIYDLFAQAGLTVRSVTDLSHAVVQDGAIVISRGHDCGGASLKAYLQRFKASGYRVGVLHLSDEWSNLPVDFYPEADFILRNYYRPGVMDQPNVHFLPLGYKKGLQQHLHNKPLSERQHYWSFAGALGGKLSRRLMVQEAEKIPGGKSYIEQGFSSSETLSFEGYVRLMGDTVFALAPGGNQCVETFRIYEALEAGAIPIVEDPPTLVILKSIARELLQPKRIRELRVWRLNYWRHNYHRLTRPSYWTAAFGEAFPCPRISRWQDLDKTLQAIDSEALALEVQTFWQGYKASLVQTLKMLVNQTLLQRP